MRKRVCIYKICEFLKQQLIFVLILQYSRIPGSSTCENVHFFCNLSVKRVLHFEKAVFSSPFKMFTDSHWGCFSVCSFTTSSYSGKVKPTNSLGDVLVKISKTKWDWAMPSSTEQTMLYLSFDLFRYFPCQKCGNEKKSWVFLFLGAQTSCNKIGIFWKSKKDNTGCFKNRFLFSNRLNFVKSKIS